MFQKKADMKWQLFLNNWAKEQEPPEYDTTEQDIWLP